jgi:ribose transport system permease protein
MIKAIDLLKNKIMIAVYIAVILILIGQIVTPGFASYSSIVNILTLSSFLGIITIGQMFVILSGNEGIDLSVGTLMSFGAVLAARIINGQDGNLFLALVMVVLVGLAFGFGNGLGVTVLKIPPLIMTLAMSSVVNGIELVYTNGLPSGSSSPLLSAIGSQRTAGVPNIFWLWIIIIAVVTVLLIYLRWSTMLYGTGSNVLTAKLSGTNTKKTIAIAYAISGMTSMLTGLLYLGYTGTAYLTIGGTYLMPSITAAVIGGVSLSGGQGNYLGASMGAIVLTILTALLMSININEATRQIIFGIVLLALLLVYARKKSI